MVICKRCGKEFKPYQITHGKRILDMYICFECFLHEAEEFGYQVRT